MSDFRERLDKYLTDRGLDRKVDQLSQDASTREYFRIKRAVDTAIACVYPEPFKRAEQTYLDVTELFGKAALPVAEVYDVDEGLGVIVQEDLGDTVLRSALQNSSKAEREALIDEAVGLIAGIQAATSLAFDTNSIASQLKFDAEKLLWELNFFKEHYFTTFRKKPLDRVTDSAVENEFVELSTELEAMASVLCHRDFHAANLMLDRSGKLRIIDHQDARIGSAVYDLVSLLLDRITEMPDNEWLVSKRSLLLQKRGSLGLKTFTVDEFSYQFRLQTVQRCLKAAGTFSFQSVNRGKTYFIPFIKPMFQAALLAIDDLQRFPALGEALRKEIT